jgi:hypothetical protein
VLRSYCLVVDVRLLELMKILIFVAIFAIILKVKEQFLLALNINMWVETSVFIVCPAMKILKRTA